MTSEAELENLFQAGIAAYQQGDYERAVIDLSQLSRSDSSAYRIKANVGLVKVYVAQKNWSDAKSLCQKIGTSTKPSLQQWSKKTLEKIDRRMASVVIAEEKNATSLASDNKSGFQPLNASPETKAGVSGKSLVNKSSDSKRIVNRQTAVDPSTPKQRIATPPATEQADLENKLSDNSESRSEELAANESLDSSAAVESRTDGAHPFSNEPSDFVWSDSDRLEKGRSLGKIKKGRLWCAQIFGAIAFYFLPRSLFHGTVAFINHVLIFLDSKLPFWVRVLPDQLSDISWYLLAVLSALLFVSPWLWDVFLRFTVGRASLPMSKLRSHSAEAATLISRYRRTKLPSLWVLPTEMPIIFSYGLLPRYARLVVSQGLLSQLKEDEIAAVIAYEMAHWKHYHWPLLSLQVLVSQTLLQLYWSLSLWANRRGKALKALAGTVATAAYSLFWLLRMPGLWVARSRTYYSDRTAVELTGNPNGLTRALTKLSFGLATSVEQQGYTPTFLEGVMPLLPSAVDFSRQRLYGHYPLPQLFTWDSLNPIRHWINGLDTHPPMGDRLRLVMLYAQHWKLTPEINLPSPPRRRKGLSSQDWKKLLAQGSPFFGTALGLVVGLALWGVGLLGTWLELPAIRWMYRNVGLMQCLICVGSTAGILLRMNAFFPDLKVSMAPSETVADWVGDPTLLPISSVPTKLPGTIVGRPGVANWLGQDLMVKTEFGLLALHFFSWLGPFGNLVSRLGTPADYRGRAVHVLGWFRRGSSPWLDVDLIETAQGKYLRAAHPIFSLVVAICLFSFGMRVFFLNDYTI
ncbi:MAG: M48 family metalloprotease [Cyanobacteria bacterium J06649_4]